MVFLPDVRKHSLKLRRHSCQVGYNSLARLTTILVYEYSRKKNSGGKRWRKNCNLN